MRHEGYDYSCEGAYFITMCAYKRLQLFGKIIKEKMELNATGNLVNQCWLELPQLYPTVHIDEYIVMPNHFHAIVFLVGAGSSGPQDGTPSPSIGTIIARFKYLATTRINDLHKSDVVKRWQRNYYEHVIRNENELLRAREYIQNNPLKWHLDKYNVRF